MRHALVLSAVLLASTIAGQQDPLPPVTPRTETPILVALAVEPVHEVPTVTLEDAARANDYATFHQLYEQTRNAAYAPLHELWTYSINDPIGAFYGADMYERFVALYPGLATYLEDYKIVDDRGNVFYPTSETRAFLLARAVEGRTVAPPEPIRVAFAKRRSGSIPATPRVRMKKAEAAPLPKAAPAPEATRLAAAPVVVAAAPEPAPDPAPVVAASMVPAIPQGAAEPVDFTARGIVLILIGLVGIGFLMLILRTPSSSAASDLGKAPH